MTHTVLAGNAWRFDGLEERARGGYAVHEYELGLGVQRLVATFPAGEGWFLGDVTYGPDGRWVLVTGGGRACLVQLSDGLVVPIPIGADGLGHAPRGGVRVAAVVDVDRGTIDPVAAARFKTAQVSRRHGNPRWCERAVPVTGNTTPHPRLMELGRTRRDEQPPPGRRGAADQCGRRRRGGPRRPGPRRRGLHR